MGFCLPQDASKKLLSAIRAGSVDPGALVKMSSAERSDFLGKIVGDENAEGTNALFESKMLLQDYKRGLVTWAKKLTGLSSTTRASFLDKINSLDRVLDPTDEKTFLADLAKQKLGASVTFDEAKSITSLAKDATEARTAIKPDDAAGSESRLSYGSKLVTLQNYVGELKHSADATLREQFGKEPIGTAVTQAKRVFSLSKALKNVGDLSSLFHQGWKALTTHPAIWAKNALASITDAARALGRPGTDTEIGDATKADIFSRPNALNGIYQKMHIDIGNVEESFPSTLPEKVPLFGRLYKATETGFAGFLYRTRADLADLYVKVASDNGIDLGDKKQLSSIGDMVNALTGRGKTSSVTSETNIVNAAIYSQKLLKSNFDYLTAHQFQKDVTPFVRKTASINLLKSVMATAAVLATAKALQPSSVTFDPRSTKFGKITLGGISFDVTGGNGSIVVLASRLISNSEVTSKGKVSQLNTGKFGAETSQDVIMDYLTGKLSPAASVILDLLNRSTFSGAKPTVGGELENAVAPFPIQNVIDGQKSVGLADSIIAEIADSFGLYETLPAPPKGK